MGTGEGDVAPAENGRTEARAVSPGPILGGVNSDTEHEHAAPVTAAGPRVVAEAGYWTLVGYSGRDRRVVGG
jgi:hypothetical protein